MPRKKPAAKRQEPTYKAGAEMNINGARFRVLEATENSLWLYSKGQVIEWKRQWFDAFTENEIKIK